MPGPTPYQQQHHTGGASRVRVWSATWRIGLALTLLTILVAAQFGRHDNWFPLGMLGQYGVPRDPDGAVLSTYLEGTTAQGATIPIELTTASSGITRVELETHLPELQADPSALAEVATVVERRNPGLDVVSLHVRQEVWRLEGGAVSGPPEIRDLISWTEP